MIIAIDPVARINYLAYQVDLLNEKLYSVTLNGEFCSAYCEHFEMSYTFDLQSGSLLTLETLFSIHGNKELSRAISEHKKSQLNQKIDELTKMIKSNTNSSEDTEYYKDMLDLYQNCDSEYTDLKDLRFIPSRDRIKIIYGRCSAHYNRNIDELWYFRKSILISDWAEHLSKIGRERLIE